MHFMPLTPCSGIFFCVWDFPGLGATIDNRVMPVMTFLVPTYSLNIDVLF